MRAKGKMNSSRSLQTFVTNTKQKTKIESTNYNVDIGNTLNLEFHAFFTTARYELKSWKISTRGVRKEGAKGAEAPHVITLSFRYLIKIQIIYAIPLYEYIQIMATI